MRYCRRPFRYTLTHVHACARLKHTQVNRVRFKPLNMQRVHGRVIDSFLVYSKYAPWHNTRTFGHTCSHPQCVELSMGVDWSCLHACMVASIYAHILRLLLSTFMLWRGIQRKIMCVYACMHACMHVIYTYIYTCPLYMPTYTIITCLHMYHILKHT
jgi:hypothetical protein